MQSGHADAPRHVIIAFTGPDDVGERAQVLAVGVSWTASSAAVGLDEKRAAVASVLRFLCQGECGQRCTRGPRRHDTVKAEAAKAAQ
jgi:hypothetical protein